MVRLETLGVQRQLGVCIFRVESQGDIEIAPGSRNAGPEDFFDVGSTGKVDVMVGQDYAVLGALKV